MSEIVAIGIVVILVFCIGIAYFVGSVSVKAEFEAKDTELQIMQSRVKSLLWNMGNQREKVQGNLNVLIEDLYPDRDLEYKITIREKLMENIK